MKKRAKTIAIFSGYTMPHLGGVEKYTDNLSQQLVKMGYKVIIVGTDYDFNHNYVDVRENIITFRIPVYKLFVTRYPIPKMNRDYKKIINELNNIPIDAIIVNTRFYLTSLIGAKFGKKYNIPVYLIEHGSQHLTVDNKILDYLGAKYEHCLTWIIKKYVNYYYGVSKGACEWQKHFGIQSNGVWYNSINDFSNDITVKKDGKCINVLYAGRILKQKGLNRLLNAFTKLESKYSNIFLTIAGDGNQLDLLKESYKSKNICFLGKVDFEKLKELYAKTDIFVYAPIWPEGLPTSILEAGLCGCAIIGSPQGGIKEVIENKRNGLMINNEKELQEALELLISNEELRTNYSKEIVKTIKKTFLWESTAKRIINDINGKISKQ